jgi:hypothetical protein
MNRINFIALPGPAMKNKTAIERLRKILKSKAKQSKSMQRQQTKTKTTTTKLKLNKIK